MRILKHIMLSMRTFVLILIMLGLPLQGVLAGIMPICTQAQHENTVAGLESQISSFTPCIQHEDASHQPSTDIHDAANEADFSPFCDGVVCHISGNGLPPATSLLNHAGEYSFADSFDSRFTSSIPQQPQHPPLS
jgi:hypothetical protein